MAYHRSDDTTIDLMATAILASPSRFGSSNSSVSCQFLVLESPFIQGIFMKMHAKNPLFEGLCYNLKGLELFSKTNFESS